MINVVDLILLRVVNMFLTMSDEVSRYVVRGFYCIMFGFTAVPDVNMSEFLFFTSMLTIWSTADFLPPDRLLCVSFDVPFFVESSSG